jgi:type IV pilus assembly protein PilO
MKLNKTQMPAIDFNQIAADFRRLNSNDVGTWPLIPKITVLFAIFVVLLVLGWWLFWSEQLDVLSQKQDEEVKLKNEYIEKKKIAVNLEAYRQQLDEIDRSFGALLKQLPNKSEMEALLIEVNQAGLGRGLQFELFRPGNEAVKDFYAELPITVKITGSYHDFGAFAADIAKLPRIVTLNDIAIAPGANGRLSMDMVAKTFRYLDESEMTEQKSQKKGKGRGK